MLFRSAFANDPTGIVVFSNLALSLIKDVELDDTVRDYFDMQALTQNVIVCSLAPVTGCDLHTAAPRLTAIIEKFYAIPRMREDYSLRIAGVAIAMYSAQSAQPIPPTVRLICLRAPSQGTDSLAVTERSVYMWGRFVIAVADKSNDGEQFIVAAATNEIQRLRHFLFQQPFETAPISYYSRTILSFAGSAIAAKPGKTTEDNELLMEIASLLNRTQRSVETQYVQVLSEMSNDTDAASLQALHRLEESLFTAEKNATRDIRVATWDELEPNRFAPESFDADRWRVLTEFAQVASRHDNVKATAANSFDGQWNLVDGLRLFLRPNERFITHFVALNKFVRICISKNEVVTGTEDFDFASTLVTQKTIQAALTNPSAPSREVDSTFPISESRKLSKLLLGSDGRCVGDATHLVVATDPGLQALPLHVLLDPAKEIDEIGNESLATAPWLGVTRAISIVIDAQELISSRRLRASKSPAPFAFLGIGDPHLSGFTQDGQPRSEVALRGVKRGAAPSLAALDSLPETRSEIEHMAATFGTSAKVLLGDNATEGNVRRQLLSNYRIISFATHGLLREEIEGITEPALVLTPVDSLAETDNGLLTATEIGELSLDADLVILSACNSANFDLQLFGPEAASLSTAFFLAGAKSTLASLWSVDSQATAELINLVGLGMKTHPEAGSAEALHGAIRKFIESASNPAYRNPRFWAAFTLYGDGGSSSPELSPLRSASVLRELNPVATPSMGEFVYAHRVATSKTLLAGYKESGGPRVTGHLRLVQDDKVIWDVTDPNYSFIPLRDFVGGVPPVLAWKWIDGTFFGEIRWYSDQGVLVGTQVMPALKDAHIDDFVLIGGGKMAVAYQLNGVESRDLILRQLDQKGIVQVERRLPFPANTSINRVRLFRGARGLWLSIKVSDPARTGKTLFNPFGSFRVCNAYQTQLRLLNETLGDSNDFRQINDIEINDVVVEGDDTDVAAVTTYDPCDGLNVSNAGIAFIRTGDKSTLHPLPYVGFSTEATKLLKRNDGGWTLIGGVRRELVPWKRDGIDWTVMLKTTDEQLIRSRRSDASGRQRGLVVAKFSKDKHFENSSMFFTGASLWISGAVSLVNSEILLVGGNNRAQFVGVLGQ